MELPPIVILAAIMCGSAIVITTLHVVSQQMSQRRAAFQPLSAEEITRRLERIEQAVETTAIEVERIAESGRFVAKLLAEHTDARSGA